MPLALSPFDRLAPRASAPDRIDFDAPFTDTARGMETRLICAHIDRYVGRSCSVRDPATGEPWVVLGLSDAGAGLVRVGLLTEPAPGEAVDPIERVGGVYPAGVAGLVWHDPARIPADPVKRWAVREFNTGFVYLLATDPARLARIYPGIADADPGPALPMGYTVWAGSGSGAPLYPWDTYRSPPEAVRAVRAAYREGFAVWAAAGRG